MAVEVSDHSRCVCYPWVSTPPSTPPPTAPGADRESGEGQVPPPADDEGLLSSHLSGWEAKVRPPVEHSRVCLKGVNRFHKNDIVR